jgi:hypothetical protein
VGLCGEVKMNDPLSINEVIDRLDELAGEQISIKGILSFEFENISISHIPRSERKDGYKSSVWFEVGCGSLTFDEKVCEALHGKVVVAEGSLVKSDPVFGGSGHFSLWPAAFLVRTLERA